MVGTRTCSSVGTHESRGQKQGGLMRPRCIGLFLFYFTLFMLCSGCDLHPRKLYPGPALSKAELALIRQMDYLETRPIFVVAPHSQSDTEIRVDDLGIVVLPGTYRFKAKLYHTHFQQSVRIGTAPVEPGKSYFPVEQSVLKEVRVDEPYKETPEISVTVEAGFRYGLWCSDDERIRMKVLGSYE